MPTCMFECGCYYIGGTGTLRHSKIFTNDVNDNYIDYCEQMRGFVNRDGIGMVGRI